MRKFAFAALFVLAGALPASASMKIAAAEKALLQAAMFQYIDRQTISGSFLHVDPKTGEIIKLVPEKAHPMILKMGDHFILCSDFRDATGRQVNMDFFMAKRGNTYVVFDRFVDNRSPVSKLHADGKALEVE